MKKLGSLKWFTLGVVVCLIVSALTIPAFAAARTKQANLQYRGIRITINGSAAVPRDGNGQVIEPFIIDGITYLPVRGIATALGLDSTWNAATNTVSLTSSQNPTRSQGTGQIIARTRTSQATLQYRDIKITLNGNTVTPRDGNGQVIEPFIIAGITYLPVRGIATALGLDSTWNATTNTVALTSSQNRAPHFTTDNGATSNWSEENREVLERMKPPKSDERQAADDFIDDMFANFGW